MRRVALSIAVALAGAGFGSDSLAQEPAGLAPRLRAAALAASPTVLVPTRLPEGWRATRAEAVATGRETYRLVYHGPEGACFAIENGLTFDRVGGARRALARLGIPGAVDSTADELGVDEEVAVYEDPDGGGTAILFTRTGGGDDSVAGVRYLVWIAEIGPGVIQYRAGRQLRCRLERGHRSWGAGPCL